ncbi:MAG: bifunctional phosphopantothenoylcysteine decarboxylase/phosphopantothenate--cysteine ligase CoaBC [Alphaproteobacteria bacterium]|nr:bifunctional phosphopantothenoylcysteine decarboxylase/phosphopantothenate--cysteine ligase CoaBC [Alphaproteobacteria bacterium]
MSPLQNKSILLVISGGIAAYKALELIRLIRKDGGTVRCILTAGGAQFITPLSVASLSEQTCYTDLWSLKDETEMGHIRLSREADLIVIAPASANMIAKMAQGITDDLASTALLAANKPIMIAPAMNHMMWLNEATQNNIRTLQSRGVTIIGPTEGDMACGEFGPGRMSEPADIREAIVNFLTAGKPLAGLSALVTSGPTYEPLDPVRFIGNRSSGKQGHAIAAALRDAGAAVTLVTGPVALPDPAGVKTIHVETATDMMTAALDTLPADIAICAAAVSDWSAITVHRQKIKKQGGSAPPDIKLKENPDILAAIARDTRKRPRLVIGFAAETENLLEAAQKKRAAKGCDWIVGNDVAAETVFGADENRVILLTAQSHQEWPKADKRMIAQKLVAEIVVHFEKTGHKQAAE